MQTLLSRGRRRSPCDGWMDAALVEVEAKGGGLKVGKWPCPFPAGILGSSSSCCAISHRDSPIAPRQDLTHRPSCLGFSPGEEISGWSVYPVHRLGGRTRSAPGTWDVRCLLLPART